MRGGPDGRLPADRSPSGPLPAASARGRGEGRVPRRGTSVPPANLAAPVRKEAELLHTARRGGGRGVEVVDDHSARGKDPDDVPDLPTHHLHPPPPDPVGRPGNQGRTHPPRL